MRKAACRGHRRTLSFSSDCRRSHSVAARKSTPVCGLASVRGRRKNMEDAVVAAPAFSEGLHFFGVFDGHNGSQAAARCSKRLHQILAAELPVAETNNKEEVWLEAMRRCFLEMDSEIIQELSSGTDTPGTTATVAVAGGGKLVVANCGDSRAVLSRAGRAMALSTDHKPERADEMARIEAAGGKVIWWNGHRVMGVLATSRSIGERYLKPYVIPDPDVTFHSLTAVDEFLVLATDGLWNVVSNEEACNVVRQCLFIGASVNRKTKCRAASVAAARLVRVALARDSSDNISVVVIDLTSLAPP